MTWLHKLLLQLSPTVAVLMCLYNKRLDDESQLLMWDVKGWTTFFSIEFLHLFQLILCSSFKGGIWMNGSEGWGAAKLCIYFYYLTREKETFFIITTHMICRLSLPFLARTLSETAADEKSIRELRWNLGWWVVGCVCSWIICKSSDLDEASKATVERQCLHE